MPRNLAPGSMSEARVALPRSGRIFTYAEPRQPRGSGPGVERMGAARRAEMRRLYEEEPRRKRATGVCPEAECNELAHDPTTGRCRRHATRWPARKSRDDCQPTTDRLIEEEVTDVAA